MCWCSTPQGVPLKSRMLETSGAAAPQLGFCQAPPWPWSVCVGAAKTTGIPCSPGLTCWPGLKSERAASELCDLGKPHGLSARSSLAHRAGEKQVLATSPDAPSPGVMVVVPALTPRAVPGAGGGGEVQALSHSVPAPALSLPTHPTPSAPPQLAPDMERTVKLTGLRDPYPSCLTTPTLKPAPGATSGPCVPHPGLSLGASSGRKLCSLLWAHRTCQLEQGAGGGHAQRSLGAPPLQPPSFPRCWASSPLLPTHGPLGSAVIVHSSLPRIESWSGLRTSLLPNRKQVAMVHFLSLFSLREPRMRHWPKSRTFLRTELAEHWPSGDPQVCRS